MVWGGIKENRTHMKGKLEARKSVASTHSSFYTGPPEVRNGVYTGKQPRTALGDSRCVRFNALDFWAMLTPECQPPR